MSTSVIPASSMHARVAAEVRAWLGRRNLSARQAAARLGWTQPYLSRRITGSVPFNVGDLEKLGDLLKVDPAKFFIDPEEDYRRPVSTGYYSLLGALHLRKRPSYSPA